MNVNPKNIIKNNLVFYLILGVIAAFIIGYFTGIASEHEKNKITQDLKNIEQEIRDLEIQESEIFKITKDDDPILGDPNASISIIEFSDYQCQFCARFYLNTLPLLDADYIQKGTVNFIYRDFPIQNHLNAMPAAIASECADDQGKFWEYHDILFQRQSMWKVLEMEFALDTFKEYALELELNQEDFDYCLDSEKYLDEVKQDLIDGQNNKVSGTPTFFIGNEQL